MHRAGSGVMRCGRSPNGVLPRAAAAQAVPSRSVKAWQFSFHVGPPDKHGKLGVWSAGVHKEHLALPRLSISQTYRWEPFPVANPNRQGKLSFWKVSVRGWLLDD